MKSKSKKKTALREYLSKAAESLFVSNYSISLALGLGVGGHLEDNSINGYVLLQADPKGPNRWDRLIWDQAKNELPGLKKIWGKLYKYIKISNVDLIMLGNDFIAGVHAISSADTNSIIKQIKDFSKPEPPPEISQTGYRLLKISGNIFHVNQNSFIAQSFIVDGNHFSGAIDSESIAAFCFGESGVFTGNIAPDKISVIERFLVHEGNAANLIKIQ